MSSKWDNLFALTNNTADGLLKGFLLNIRTFGFHPRFKLDRINVSFLFAFSFSPK